MMHSFSNAVSNETGFVQFPKNVQMVKWLSIRVCLVWLVGFSLPQNLPSPFCAGQVYAWFFFLGYSLKLKFDYRKVPASLLLKSLRYCTSDLVLMLPYIGLGKYIELNSWKGIYFTNLINGLEQSSLVWTVVVHFSVVDSLLGSDIFNPFYLSIILFTVYACIEFYVIIVISF